MDTRAATIMETLDRYSESLAKLLQHIDEAKLFQENNIGKIGFN